MPPFTIMGVVNVTPDSFSDGGTFADPVSAIVHGRRLATEGAAIIDVGGESTRPGAAPVPPEEELERVIPVVEGIAGLDLPVQISIDTMKLAVAEAALDAGATYVNDVTAFRHEPELAELVADRGVDCCLMHMLGEPRTMQDDPRYEDVVDDVKAFLTERMQFATAAGIAEDRIYLDPVGDQRVGLADVEAHVEHQPLTDLALGGRDSVVRVERQSDDLDGDPDLGAFFVIVVVGQVVLVVVVLVGIAGHRPNVAAATCSASKVAATSWTRKTRAPRS